MRKVKYKWNFFFQERKIRFCKIHFIHNLQEIRCRDLSKKQNFVKISFLKGGKERNMIESSKFLHDTLHYIFNRATVKTPYYINDI